MTVEAPSSTTSAPQGRILVIRGGAIGDFIVTLPVLAALRERFPGARLELLTYPNVAPLAVRAGLADEARAIESRPLAGFFARGGRLDPAESARLAACEVIFSYLYDPDGLFRDNVARVSRAQVIPGPHRPDEVLGVPASVQLLAPLERLAIFDADPVPRLRWAGMGGGQGGWIALHPGSGSPSKNWPLERWEGLVDRLVGSTDLGLVLVGGDAEGDALGRLGARIPAPRRRLLRGEPLDVLAGHLSACQGFIGHDSGITHLAAAVGIPCLVLWGPSSEAVWRPPGPRVRTRSHPGGLAALGLDTVWEALRATLACP